MKNSVMALFRLIEDYHVSMQVGILKKTRWRDTNQGYSNYCGNFKGLWQHNMFYCQIRLKNSQRISP